MLCSPDMNDVQHLERGGEVGRKDMKGREGVCEYMVFEIIFRRSAP